MDMIKTPLGDLEGLLSIDEGNLAGEWVEQPRIYLRVCREAARAEAAVWNAEKARDKYYADLYVRFKKEGFSDVGRVTEELIKQTIELDVEHQKLEQEILEAKYVMKIFQSLVRAFEQRERSLKYIQIGMQIPSEYGSSKYDAAAAKIALQAESIKSRVKS